jgi:phenylalanyl-tRNA synthetase beta chain
MQEKVLYKPLSPYPEVVRDIAFVVDKNVLHADIEMSLRNVDELIQSVELFDVYQGERLGENKKSMAYHIVYGSSEKTLMTEEVDATHKKVLQTLENQFGVEIRK